MNLTAANLIHGHTGTSKLASVDLVPPASLRDLPRRSEGRSSNDTSCSSGVGENTGAAGSGSPGKIEFTGPDTPARLWELGDLF